MTTQVQPPQAVTYWAKSILVSRTFWINAISLVVSVLSATDVIAVIPARYAPMVAALVAALNIYLRTITVRPVALIAPSATEQVLVEKLPHPAALGT